MTRKRKLQIIVPIVILLFVGALIRHRYLAGQITITGRLQNKKMNEISGMAASGIQKNVYYVHNDSGDTSRFFAISPEGKLYSTIDLTDYTGTLLPAYDCEEVAVGPGPLTNQSYLYIGDIGDNYAIRKYISIQRVRENKSWLSGAEKKAQAATLYLKYPDGMYDAETLMIDPLEKLFYIVTKRKDTVRVYTAPLIFRAKDTVSLTYRTKLFFEGVKPLKWITSGDISKDGQQVLLKSYEKVYYWRRKEGEAIWQTLQRKPREMNYESEKQGEAIAFSADGKGYFTVSEGVFSSIYFYHTP